ncbi:cystin-1 [Phalacrocorax carbo]|uniref:cystin-1 n=1 Tax=Phalacrocorax carbo TaxID=9209 RepID=UPI003119CCC2
MGSGSSRRRGAAAAAAAPAGRAAAEDRELLERVLAECEEAAALPGPGRRAPAAGGIPPARGAGRCGEAAAGGGGGGGGGPPPEQAALSPRRPPGPENNADHQCPERNGKKPAGQSTISYDYSEEELMASIEQEYCR